MTLEQQLTALIQQSGGARAATRLIDQVRGAAPSHTTLARAANGNYNAYSIRCMIDDLKQALLTKGRNHRKFYVGTGHY